MYELKNNASQLRPREKLKEHGIDVLSNAELLAIILNVGTRKESVLDMSARIIKDYGSSALSGVRDYRKLQTYLELGEVKSMQVAAVLEIGRRVYLEKRGKRPLLNSPQKIYNRFQYLNTKMKEELRVLYLNSRQILILSELIALGSINFLYARKRDVLATALEYSASGVVLLHNHPSGDPNPSKADIEFTSSMIQAAALLEVEVLDHIIIGSEGFFSFRDAGLLESADNSETLFPKKLHP